MSAGLIGSALLLGRASREAQEQAKARLENELLQQKLQQGQAQFEQSQQLQQAELQAQQAQFQQQQEQRQMEQQAEAKRVERELEQERLLATQTQRGQTIRTALAKGLTVDPAVLQEFGIEADQQADRLTKAAAARRGSRAGQRATLQGAAPGEAPEAAQPTGGPPGLFDLIQPGAPAQIQTTPGAIDLPQQVPSGAGFVAGDGRIAAFQAPPQITQLSEDDRKAKAIEDFRAAGVPENRLNAIIRLAGDLTANQLINQLEDALPSAQTTRQTDLQRSQTKARTRELETQQIVTSGNEDVIKEEARRLGMPFAEDETTEAHQEFLKMKVQRSQIVQQAASPTVQVAINPQTGERLVVRDGKWVPAQ